MKPQISSLRKQEMSLEAAKR